jgi:hypothetical protein
MGSLVLSIAVSVSNFLPRFLLKPTEIDHIAIYDPGISANVLALVMMP